MKPRIRNVMLLAGTGLLAAAVISSCKKDDNTLPKIGPYDNSDQIASANLKARWTFDGTNNESISGIAPTTSQGVSFTTGVKGQALSLNNGYLLYPTIANLSSANALNSVTISMWVNTNNRVDKATSFFAITAPTSVQDDWNRGPINMYAETGKPLTYNDTLVLHSAFHSYRNGNYTEVGGDNINDYGVRGTDFQTVLGTNKWVHYVMRYDASGSFLDLFANGTRVSNNNFRFRHDANDIGWGNIIINPPTQVLIGGFPNADAGFSNSPAQTWQGLMVGSIDEIRVYNAALTDQDIGYLYQLEKEGR